MPDTKQDFDHIPGCRCHIMHPYIVLGNDDHAVVFREGDPCKCVYWANGGGNPFARAKDWLYGIPNEVPPVPYILAESVLLAIDEAHAKSLISGDAHEHLSNRVRGIAKGEPPCQ